VLSNVNKRTADSHRYDIVNYLTRTETIPFIASAPQLELSALSKVEEVAREALRGSFLVFVGNTCSTLILVLTSIAMARLLGPSGYGLYSVTLIVPSLMLLFTDFGVDAALVRFVARLRAEGGSAGDIVRAGVLFKLASSASMSLLALLLADALASQLLSRPGAGQLVRIASLSIVGSALVTTSNNAFAGLDRMDRLALVSVAQALTKASLVIALIALGLGVTGALAGHVSSTLVAGSLGAAMAFLLCGQRGRGSGEGGISGSALASMLRYGLPLYASTLIAGLLGQYQSLVLARLTSDAEVGNYTVAVAFSAAVALLTTPISTALFPAFSKVSPRGDEPELRSLFSNSLRYTLLLVIPAAAFIATNSRPLVALFYGSSYAQAPLYLSLYSITFVIGGFSLVLSNLFNGTGRTDMALRATLIHLPFLLVLAPALTWLFRVQGFICALLASSVPPLAYLALAAKEEYGLGFSLRHLARTCAASLLSSLPTMALSFSLPCSRPELVVLEAAVFVLTYMTLAPVVGAVGEADIVNLRSVTKGLRVIGPLANLALSYEERMISLTGRSTDRRGAT
jgi:O-antigen/teichoic acid export membrane protein